MPGRINAANVFNKLNCRNMIKLGIAVTIGGNVIVHIKNSRILYDDGMRKRLIA